MKDISKLNHFLSQATAIKSKLQTNFDRVEKNAQKFEAAFQSALQSQSVVQGVSAVKQTAQAEKSNLLQTGLALNNAVQQFLVANPQAAAPVANATSVTSAAAPANASAAPPPTAATSVAPVSASSTKVASLPASAVAAPLAAPVLTQNGTQQAVTLRDTFDMQKALIAKGMNADQAQAAVSQTLGINVIKPDFSNYTPDYAMVKSAGYINTPSGWVVDPNYNPGT